MKKILACIALLAAVCACQGQPTVGAVAPNIKLYNEAGNEVNLASLRGKVVVLDFWASWCGPCRRSIPALKEIYKKYKDKGLEVFAVSVDTDKDQWLRAIKEDATTWVHVMDGDYAVARRWKVNYIPNTYLIDRTGKIISINANHVALEQQIAGLIN
jgi:thiol-disulfide isomerase/thioredoxin